MTSTYMVVQGQASTLARNETGITKCEEEMEELEEQMRESVHRALQDKVKVRLTIDKDMLLGPAAEIGMV